MNNWGGCEGGMRGNKSKSGNLDVKSKRVSGERAEVEELLIFVSDD